MKNRIAFLTALLFCLSANAQNQPARKLRYANVDMVLPAGYSSDSDTSIAGADFTVQWSTISEIMYQKNVHKQMIKKM